MEVISAYNTLPIKQESKAKIKFLGRIKVEKNVKIKDKMIKRIMIDDYIFSFYFKPTISQMYLLSNTKIPIVYCRTDYMKNLIRRPLMSIWLFFNADEEKYIKKKKLVGTISGSYVLEAELDGEFQEIETYKKFPGREHIYNRMEEIMRDDDSVEIFNALITEINEKRKKEGKNLNFPQEPPKITISKEDIDNMR